ncbi:dihydroxyacetone kinase family protein [Microbacterium sp. CBA3102]|uniref:dihydroxyacetone kinase family protein n=1 Tax=Microbacterium sp. CBA3102 TaxID=2603598 RepID=UPI0011BB2229|nr:dihydroxyacetone kinase family protein [Microbacterium sp. CBA3102]QEA27293.1 dihydroxyacetone kinase family protein [Microbacterium sp. CBA3102]
MTRLFDQPDDFAADSAVGFVAASSRWVRPVSGGVVRSTRGADPTVAVVIGGGSGHYPAFAGLVGPGLAHGAVMGNLFASPSAHQVHAVATAAHEGRGVLLSYGNYAGDVLHFSRAQERLRAAGIDCRTVTVTDDISSAPASEHRNRRGIAGDLVVFKIAGGAAEEGMSLDDVERVAVLANERTRSLGVAFSGCTLPGAEEPLFTVPEGRMAVGLGIHGEPGIDEVDVPTATGLAELFVSSLLAEVPDGVDVAGARVVPILNGLGSVKYEELYVVYAAVDRLLSEAGLTVVSPEVGEFCTSFDMAGVSLTLLWLDEELERLWHVPCDTPAYRRGAVGGRIARDSVLLAPEDEVVIGPASEASRRAAATIGRALDDIAHMLHAQAEELGRLDRIAGDGDHGIGMQRGSRAASAAAATAIAAGAGARTALHRAGDAWADQGGGTSGAIWGEMLGALGTALGDDAVVDAAAVGGGIVRMKEAVMSYGKATVGDKTMIDAIVPFADRLRARLSAGDDLTVAWADAAETASVAAQATATLTARLGRARSHGDRSLGTPDPGAISFALITHTVHHILEGDD